MLELIKSSRNRSKVDLFKLSKLSLSVLNEYTPANETSRSKFVRSLVGDDDISPSSPIHASKRDGAELKILSDYKESNFERPGANPRNSEHSSSMAPKVDDESADDESGYTKAVGLQQRACKTLFESMSAAGQEKVERCASREYSDFIGTDDIVEVTMNVKSINCERCGTTDSITGMCEESIAV